MTAAGMLADVKHDERHIAFRDLIDNDGRYRIHPLGALTDELAVIQYTGGTTGSPKGAMLTHANLTAACSLYTEVMTRGEARPARRRGAGLVHPAALPHLFAHRRHAARLQVGRGARPSSALRSGRRRQGHRRKEDHRLHGRADDACRHPQRARSSKKWISRRCACAASGGAPLPVAVQERFESIIGCQLNEGWGMTETAPARDLQPARGRKTKPAPAGFPTPARR